MQLGMIDLGRNGANVVRRLVHNGRSGVVSDRSPDGVCEFVKDKRPARHPWRSWRNSSRSRKHSGEWSRLRS